MTPIDPDKFVQWLAMQLSSYAADAYWDDDDDFVQGRAAALEEIRDLVHEDYFAGVSND